MDWRENEEIAWKLSNIKEYSARGCGPEYIKVQTNCLHQELYQPDAFGDKIFGSPND